MPRIRGFLVAVALFAAGVPIHGALGGRVAWAAPGSLGSRSMPAPTAPSSPAPPPSSFPTGGLVVRVVDEKGAPLAGAEVEGLALRNPGPVASTCCTPERFALVTTGPDGRALVTHVPFTFRPLHFHVTYRDWPARETIQSPGMDKSGTLTVMLGPARDLAGAVMPDPTCSFDQLILSAGPPTQSPSIDAQGRFMLRGVPPWATVWLSGCHRYLRVDLKPPSEEPVRLVLPPAKAATPNGPHR